MTTSTTKKVQSGTFKMAVLASIVGLIVAGGGLYFEDDIFKFTGLSIVVGAAGVGALARKKG